MLVLSRKKGEEIRIGDNIVVTVHRLSGNRVSIGIQAPDTCRIVRGELQQGEGSSTPASEEAPAAVQPPMVESRPARTAAPIKVSRKSLGENRIAAHLPQSMRLPK
jgi:carbon storage regulator